MLKHRLLTCCLLIAAAFSLVASGCSKPVSAGPRAQASAVEDIRKTLSAGAETSAGGEEATETAATGWATIKGKFKIDGAGPAQGPPLAIAKANADCSKHEVFDESLVIRGDALEGAVIFARTAKLPIKEGVEASRPPVLDNSKCRFEPHVVFVQAGQKLEVKNTDPFGHNTKIDSVANPAQNFSLPGGAVIEHVFAKEESLPVKVGCSIHPWMGAWVLVRGNPYGAVSNDQGEFVIANLPAGKEIEFQLWQEKLGFLKNATAEGLKIDGKGRFKTKLEPDQELVLEFTLPADSLK